MQGMGDQADAHPLAGQPDSEQPRLNVAVVTLGFVTQVVVTQALLRQGHDAGPGAFFDLANCGQYCELPNQAILLTTRFCRALLTV